MRHGKLTETVVRKLIENAEEILEKLKKENCEPSGRCQADEDEIEYCATIDCVDKDGVLRVLSAYYYTTQEEESKMWDGSEIDWVIEGYELD